jgi:hypothetical protein
LGTQPRQFAQQRLEHVQRQAKLVSVAAVRVDQRSLSRAEGKEGLQLEAADARGNSRIPRLADPGLDVFTSLCMRPASQQDQQLISENASRVRMALPGGPARAVGGGEDVRNCALFIGMARSTVDAESMVSPDQVPW